MKQPDQSRPSVSIVIPAHNEERHLRPCLEAIARQTVRPHEVIVADNGSTDRTVEVATAFEFARVVKEPRRGRVFARNAGFRAATGRIIGRIDADNILPSDWVEHIQRFYADGANRGKAWSGAGHFYNVRMPRLVSFGFSFMAFRFNKLLLGHYTLWGSNMAVTREQWQAVQEDVCLRNDIHEDLDLAIHLVDRGYRIAYDHAFKTNAELRRVHSDRGSLWSYLEWWPRTLRVHGNRWWPVCWFFGALLLYLATYILLWAEKVALYRRQLTTALDARGH